MLCPSCGKEVVETDARCGFCGSSLSKGKPPTAESLHRVTGTAPPESPEPPSRRSGKAIASLILGIVPFLFVAGIGLLAIYFGLVVSLGFLCLVSVAALLAIIYGHRAMTTIRRSGRRILGKGMATVGLVLGYVWLASWIALIATLIFFPPFVCSRLAANQAAAVGALRTINTAAVTYSSTYDHGYPPSLLALGPPKADKTKVIVKEGENAAAMIDDWLASGTKFGYRFTYAAGPVDSTGKIQTYAVYADPAEPGVSGKMYYFTDQTNVIRVEEGREAYKDSPPIN